MEGRGGVRVQNANEKDKQSEMHAPPVLLAENKKSWTPNHSTMLNCSAGLNSFHSHRDVARQLLTASCTSPLQRETARKDIACIRTSSVPHITI